MRNTIGRNTGGRKSRDLLATLLEHARFEVLPSKGVVDAVSEHLAPGRTVTVTASPSRGLDATLHTAFALSERGYVAVPHIAARMVSDRGHLGDIVAQLAAASIDRVFIPGGDGTPVGRYADALALVTDLSALDTHLRSVGITAYPESHPTISDDRTVQSMWDKRHHATEMVSNLTFDPSVFDTWLTRVRDREVTLPLWIGIPGTTNSAKLLDVATRIGVGDSTRFLLKNRRTVTTLLRPGGFDTSRFLRTLAPRLARADALVAGLHVFTFNQIAESEAWRARLLEQLHQGGDIRRAPTPHPQHDLSGPQVSEPPVPS